MRSDYKKLEIQTLFSCRTFQMMLNSYHMFSTSSEKDRERNRRYLSQKYGAGFHSVMFFYEDILKKELDLSQVGYLLAQHVEGKPGFLRVEPRNRKPR